MAFTFNLVALLNVLLAGAGLWAALPELRGRPAKLWRLAVPPFFGTVVAIILLAGGPPNHGLEARWVLAAALGAAAGAAMGNRVKVETDQMWGLVRLKPSYAGVATAVGVLLMALTDSVTTFLGLPPAPPERDPAIGAALFAGLLDGRAWTMAIRAARAPHVELHDT